MHIRVFRNILLITEYISFKFFRLKILCIKVVLSREYFGKNSVVSGVSKRHHCKEMKEIEKKTKHCGIKLNKSEMLKLPNTYSLILILSITLGITETFSARGTSIITFADGVHVYDVNISGLVDGPITVNITSKH